MTLGPKISQGTLQGTLLCSEASSELLTGVINNNKAIIFYSSFGVIALFLDLGSFRFNFFSLGQAFYFRFVLMQLHLQRPAKFHCPQNKTQTQS